MNRIQDSACRRSDLTQTLLFEILPLVLLIWTLVKKADAMQRLLIIYWRVSSLLAITVYLMIGSLPVSFVSGMLARVLIPVGLWFWLDLNEEIADQSSSLLRWVFTSWRWAVSLYCGLGALASIPFLQCAVSKETFTAPFCQVWLDPPFGYKNFFHAASKPEFLGFLGITALVIYVLYLGYFVLVRLGKQGRSAAQQ
jgi:hypothetical protein